MKLQTVITQAAALLAAALALQPAASAQEKPIGFHVLNQRTIALTAQYWNPILTYVSKKADVPLELKLTKTAQEGNAIAERGGYGFLYTTSSRPSATGSASR